MQEKVIRYSEAFKLQVVKELEDGTLESIEEARRVYGIGGSFTIHRWLKKYGKEHIRPKIVRIELPEEKDRIKELKEENRRLKMIISDISAREVLERAYFAVLCKEKGVEDIENYKKKLDKKVSERLGILPESKAKK